MAEGAAFAGRTGCLFVEASAKTAVGVTEAFNDVVVRIIDTPSLWREDKPKSSGGGAAKAGAAVPRAAAANANTVSMPGNIDLSQTQEDEDASGICSC
jgi:Ras-related protein Rab-18